jgi:hypothetical protein
MPKRTKSPDERELLLQMVEEAYRLPNWNETSLRSTLQRVSEEIAGWRPPHAKRSIADIVVHCAYWKYALRLKLGAGRRGSFPLKGSNWFKTPDPLSREQWKEYRALLAEQHEQLVETIANVSTVLSHAKPGRGGRWTTVQRTYWLAIHDGYHTGQINLIKAMYRRAKK